MNIVVKVDKWKLFAHYLRNPRHTFEDQIQNILRTIEVDTNLLDALI